MTLNKPFKTKNKELFSLKTLSALVIFIVVVIGIIISFSSLLMGKKYKGSPIRDTEITPSILYTYTPNIPDGYALVAYTPVPTQSLPTLQPLPTYTPYPTYTPFPESGLSKDEIEQIIYLREHPIVPGTDFRVYESYKWIEVQTIPIKLSFYYPPYGGINCGEDCIHMANGNRWWDNQSIGYAIACPVELSFGTKVVIAGYIFECRDRGGEIIINGGFYWLDILYPYLPFGYYGQETEGIIIRERE